MTTVTTIPPHPAKFSASVLLKIRDVLTDWLPAGGRVLDPFAGVGTLGAHLDTLPPDARRNPTKRYTYAISLGREPSPGSSAGLQWTGRQGDEYRALHEQVWRECRRVTRPGGLLVLNVSDHVRDREQAPVSVWHMGALVRAGWDLVECHSVRTPRQGHGENGRARADREHVLVWRRP